MDPITTKTVKWEIIAIHSSIGTVMILVIPVACKQVTKETSKGKTNHFQSHAQSSVSKKFSAENRC